MPILFFRCTGKYSGRNFLSDSHRLENFIKKQAFSLKFKVTIYFILKIIFIYINLSSYINTFIILAIEI